MSRSSASIKTVGFLVDPAPDITPAIQESINTVLDSLKRQDYQPVLIEATPQRLTLDKLSTIDVVFLQCYKAIYGGGVIQGALNFHQVPYIGAKILAAAMASNRYAHKYLWELTGIQTPKFFVIAHHDSWQQECTNFKKRLRFPVIIKPLHKYVKLDSLLVSHKKQLEPKVQQAFNSSEQLIIEEFINSNLFVGGVLQTQSTVEILPIVEVKNRNVLSEARLPAAQHRKLQKIAIKCHETIGGHGFSRCEMLVDPFGKIWATEIDILPSLSRGSDFVIAAQESGILYDELIEHILLSAIRETIMVKFVGLST